MLHEETGFWLPTRPRRRQRKRSAAPGQVRQVCADAQFVHIVSGKGKRRRPLG
jgi:hypothetical protein